MRLLSRISRSLSGDLGMGDYFTHTRSIIRGKGNTGSVLPYADFEYGRMFAKLIRWVSKRRRWATVIWNWLAGSAWMALKRIRPPCKGWIEEKPRFLWGIGTLQETPLGGIMLNAFHDVRKSKGLSFEAIYAAELDLPSVTLYPLLGLEYQSKEYVSYYYGISAQEATTSHYAEYQPLGARNHFVGLIGDIKLSDKYHLNCYVRRKWMGDSIQHSPIVSQSYMDTGYVALSYRFK